MGPNRPGVECYRQPVEFGSWSGRDKGDTPDEELDFPPCFTLVGECPVHYLEGINFDDFFLK